MNNIGTDLLFLDEVKKKNFDQRKSRYLSKTLVSSEVKLLDQNHLNFNFWLLWSLKESAYKYYMQLSGELPKLNPKAYQLMNWNSTSASMKLPNQELIELEIWNDQNFIFTSTFSKEFIHLSKHSFSSKFPIRKANDSKWKALKNRIQKTDVNIPYIQAFEKKYWVSKTHEDKCEVLSVPLEIWHAF